MKIHVALMTQNELLDLKENVEGLLPHVDSVTIVDGGSLDGTIPYMRNLSRQTNGKVRFFIHPWTDNFPAQRNNYLRRVGHQLLCGITRQPGGYVHSVRTAGEAVSLPPYGPPLSTVKSSPPHGKNTFEATLCT